jgi:hypothetical protein
LLIFFLPGLNFILEKKIVNMINKTLKLSLLIRILLLSSFFLIIFTKRASTLDDTLEDVIQNDLSFKNDDSNNINNDEKKDTTETDNDNDNDHKIGISYEEQNERTTWTMFLILCIVAVSILVIHALFKFQFHYLPESLAVVFLGAVIGLVFKLLHTYNIADWSKEEAFKPAVFFLVLLPPIIFESGYSMHKGNFFENIGSIVVFAIFGTAISAFVMGSGIYILGQIDITYALNAKESFAFGSLVSAVDPVATLAIFNALDIDPILHMLVFGESILNDAVAIVLTNTIMDLSEQSHSFFYIIGHLVGNFCLMFFASAIIGVVFGLISALVTILQNKNIIIQLIKINFFQSCSNMSICERRLHWKQLLCLSLCIHHTPLQKL